MNQLWLLSHEDSLLHQLLRTRRRHGSTDIGHSGRQFRILRNRFLPMLGTRAAWYAAPAEGAEAASSDSLNVGGD